MKNKSVLIKILIAVGIVGISAYFLFASVAFRPNTKDLMCTNLRISIFAKSKLIEVKEVNNLLIKSNLHPIGMSIADIQPEAIEKMLRRQPAIQSVEAYFLPNSRQLQLEIYLREPKFVVSGRESYYVDAERRIMPLSPNTTVFVPIVTGTVTHTFAKNQLYDFVDFLELNPFWNAQIEQINVTPEQNIELVPRVGDAIINLGKLENYQLKLERVRKLYQQGFNLLGWNKYKELKLNYDDQVVCVKADNIK